MAVLCQHCTSCSNLVSKCSIKRNEIHIFDSAVKTVIDIKCLTKMNTGSQVDSKNFHHLAYGGFTWGIRVNYDKSCKIEK